MKGPPTRRYEFGPFVLNPAEHSLLRDGRPVPTELAVLYAALGEREKAFASLERASAERDYQLRYLSFPEFDSLRSDPRFQDLVRRVGLPQ